MVATLPAHSVAGSMLCGNQSAMSLRGKWKPGGITPTMVWGTPSMSRVCPITRGLLPKYSCQTPELTMTTPDVRQCVPPKMPGLFGRISSNVNVRPSVGSIRSTRNRSAVTPAADRRAGRPAISNVTSRGAG